MDGKGAVSRRWRGEPRAVSGRMHAARRRGAAIRSPRGFFREFNGSYRPHGAGDRAGGPI